MALSSSANFLYHHSQITVDDRIPADAVLSIYSIPEKYQKRPLIDSEIKYFSHFYDSLIADKYHITEKRLPVPGMIVAAWRSNRWYPAIVTSERFAGKHDAPSCCIILTETGEQIPSCNIEAQIRFMRRKFLHFLPLAAVVEDKNEPRRIVRVERRHSSEDEQVDYMALIPLEEIVPFDYKFPEEPLLKPMLEKRKTCDGPVGNYLTVASVKIMVTAVNSPDDFIFVIDRHNEMKNWLQAKMGDLYSKLDTDEYFVPKSMVVEKLPVIVLASNGMCWTRAYVGSILDDDICVVNPVDGSEPFQVYKRQLRFVHRSIAHIPRMGYRGKLTGFLPRKHNWTDDAKRVFSNLAKMGTDEYVFGLISYFTIDGAAAMHIWSRGGKDDKEVWIGEEMIARLLAKPDPTPPEKQRCRASIKHNEQMALLTECAVADGFMSPAEDEEEDEKEKKQQKNQNRNHDDDFDQQQWSNEKIAAMSSASASGSSTMTKNYPLCRP